MSDSSIISDEEKVKEGRRLIEMQKELVPLVIAMGKSEATLKALQEELFFLLSGFKEKLDMRPDCCHLQSAMYWADLSIL